MRFVAAILIALSAAACRPGVYDIDRMKDPVEKARYSCQYLLERTLATTDEKGADGVLRRRIADFAEPRVTRSGDEVRTVWAPGQITLRATGARHGGSCDMTIRDMGRRVNAITLDGQPIPAGFGM